MKPEWYLKLPIEIIKSICTDFRLDMNLVAAICQHESVGVNYKTRYEANTPDSYLQFYRDYASKLEISHNTERLAQMHSHGLMQVMGYNIRHYGFQGYLSEICANPDLAIYYGCRHLRYLSEKCHSEDEIVSAYNFGHVSRTKGGMFLNQKTYVDKVYFYLRELRRLP